MKKLLVTLLFLTSYCAFSATWVGICNDGKNIQYNQTEEGRGILYMKVKDDQGRYSTYQMGVLEQTFENGISICGTFVGNANGSFGGPMTQLCMNRSRNIIYVKYQHPYQDQPMKSGVFCNAQVFIN